MIHFKKVFPDSVMNIISKKFFNKMEVMILAGEKFLIIEDEIKIARFIELELKYEGYFVEQEHDGRSGLERALKGDFDLIILDVMLPSLNGMEVLKAVASILSCASNYAHS